MTDRFAELSAITKEGARRRAVDALTDDDARWTLAVVQAELLSDENLRGRAEYALTAQPIRDLSRADLLDELWESLDDEEDDPDAGDHTWPSCDDPDRGLVGKRTMAEITKDDQEPTETDRVLAKVHAVVEALALTSCGFDDKNALEMADAVVQAVRDEN